MPLNEGLRDPALPFPVVSSCSLVSGHGKGHAEVFGVNLRRGWVPLHTMGSPSSSRSSCAFPGRSDPGEPRDERRSLITVIYYFLCNGCYETWDLVPGTTGNMWKMTPTNESFPWEDLQTNLGRGAQARLGSGWGWVGLTVAAPFYLWEPPGRK